MTDHLKTTIPHILSGCQVLRLKHSVQPVQYMERIVRAGGCLVLLRALAAQARGPGFDSQRLLDFHFLLLRLFIFQLRQDVQKQAYLPVYLTYDQLRG